VVSANDKAVVEIHLSGGECHDAPEGRKSIEAVGRKFPGVPILMDRAYEGDETRALAKTYGPEPVVPPKKNRKDPWDYDREIYKRRNIVERLFRHLKEFRKVNTRYDKLDVMFLAYVQFALVMMWIR
jgi:transposase